MDHITIIIKNITARIKANQDIDLDIQDSLITCYLLGVFIQKTIKEFK